MAIHGDWRHYKKSLREEKLVHRNYNEGHEERLRISELAQVKTGCME